MHITTLTQYAWIGWLVLIGIFLVIEMFTLEFTFLMLAVGAVFGLGAGLLGAELWLQLVVAAIAALALIFLLRPPLLRRLHRGEDKTLSNIEALIGMSGIVLETVTATAGQAKLANGDIWSARSAHFAIPPATPVTVSAIRGAVADVEIATQEGVIP